MSGLNSTSHHLGPEGREGARDHYPGAANAANTSEALNAHRNMQWWLERHFPSLRFPYTQTNREDQAAASIVRFIDSGFPVVVSVSHASVQGHIVLVTGYENYEPRMSSDSFRLVVYDPCGRFDPWLLARAFAADRWKGGQSRITGVESGLWMANRVPIVAASRRRTGDPVAGTYYLLSVSR